MSRTITLDLALKYYRKENGRLGKSVTKLDNEFLKNRD